MIGVQNISKTIITALLAFIVNASAWAGDQGPALISLLALNATTSTATVELTGYEGTECSTAMVPVVSGSLGDLFYELLVFAEAHAMPVNLTYQSSNCLITLVEIVK